MHRKRYCVTYVALTTTFGASKVEYWAENDNLWLMLPWLQYSVQAKLNTEQKKVICHLHCLDNKINCKHRKAADKETDNSRIYRTWAIPLQDHSLLAMFNLHKDTQLHLLNFVIATIMPAPINLEYEVQLPLLSYTLAMYFMLVNCVQSRSCHKVFV
mgnify:CR=1 FL=1